MTANLPRSVRVVIRTVPKSVREVASNIRSTKKEILNKIVKLKNNASRKRDIPNFSSEVRLDGKD